MHKLETKIAIRSGKPGHLSRLWYLHKKNIAHDEQKAKMPLMHMSEDKYVKKLVIDATK